MSNEEPLENTDSPPTPSAVEEDANLSKNALKKKLKAEKAAAAKAAKAKAKVSWN